MKYWNKFGALALLLILVWASSGYAQKEGTLDSYRMNRDINIMETILEEMFKIEGKFNNGDFIIAGDHFFDSSQDVRGTYLPGYGVLFTIPVGDTPLIFDFDREDNRQLFSYSFVYSSTGDGDDKVDEKTVIQKIREFLKDYGSTIGQLNPGDQVAVIYGHDRDKQKVIFMNPERQPKKSTFPAILGQVQKKDLDAYRTGKINEQQFEDRISVTSMDTDGDQHLDLEVMANILKTVFQEHPDKESFRIRGSVSHLKLDHFGALFFFDLSYPSSTSDVIRVNLASRLQAPSAARPAPKGSASILQELDKKMEDEQKAQTDRMQELRKKVANAFTEFKQRLKEYMVDYGRTLRSVGSDQLIMATISFTGVTPDIPKRLDIMVEKSVLEALDLGRISREEALKQIRITEQMQ